MIDCRSADEPLFSHRDVQRCPPKPWNIVGSARRDRSHVAEPAGSAAAIQPVDGEPEAGGGGVAEDYADEKRSRCEVEGHTAVLHDGELEEPGEKHGEPETVSEPAIGDDEAEWV